MKKKKNGEKGVASDQPRLLREPGESKNHFTGRKKKAKAKMAAEARDGDIVSRVKEYTGRLGHLDKLDRLKAMFTDLGLDLGEDSEGLLSITQYLKVVKGVWVIIHDFMDAKARNIIPHRFNTEQQLRNYTMINNKIYPKEAAKDPATYPVNKLLAHIHHRRLS